MSFTATILPIGCKVLRNSLGSSLCIGVSTTPGATALKRIPSFAYSIARHRVTVFRPPFVIIETEPIASGDRLIGRRCSDGHNVSRFLFQHLLHSELGDVEEAQ